MNKDTTTCKVKQMHKWNPTSREQRGDENSTISWARYASCLQMLETSGVLVSVMMTCVYVCGGMVEKCCHWVFA